MFDLDGRVALVTGASSGIGERAARCLAGATVVVVARRAERLEALAADLNGSIALPADLSNPAVPPAVVGEVAELCGRVDVLVNAAGVADGGAASRESPDDFSSVIALNLVSAFALAQAAAGVMRENGGGSIVNVSSVMAEISEPSLPMAGYVASKGGLSALTRELAVQWARHGVRVNNLAPGWFPTEMTAALTENEARATEFLGRRIPLGRFGVLEELDGALLLLASSAGNYITGQTIVVDGGATAL